MAASAKRDQEIRLIWTENQWLYMVVGFLGGLLFCFLAQLSIFNLSELARDLVPEATGMFVTVVVIDQLNRRRDERNSIRQLKEQLVRDASSIVNDVAVNAVHQLRKRGWLEGDNGLLANADLWGANLRGADLSAANLRMAGLINANLKGATLSTANMQDAYLDIANLQATFLYGANLQRAHLFHSFLHRADLTRANLQEAILRQTELQGANFTQAELHNTDLTEAVFDETTILPDGSFWTKDTDMKKFTQRESEVKSE